MRFIDLPASACDNARKQPETQGMFSPDTSGQRSKGRQKLQAAPIWPWRKAYSAWKEGCQLNAQHPHVIKQVANDAEKNWL